ncbi:hypothetical protein P4O66_014492 [Electrophorus voltai]|uniref:Uncharacterized protein n=1 Tax=Electrophorus voltai TaxID=2609070 RepID=A0AAD8Z314_9TELE|nr:hypothetical protein P4O66_014492 [Electrophorus voltai]
MWARVYRRLVEPQGFERQPGREWVENSGPRPQTSEPRAQTSDLRPQSPDLRPQTPDPRDQTSDPRPQSPEPRSQTPEPRALEPRPQTSEPRAQTPDLRAQSPDPRSQTSEVHQQPGTGTTGVSHGHLHLKLTLQESAHTKNSSQLWLSARLPGWDSICRSFPAAGVLVLGSWVLLLLNTDLPRMPGKGKKKKGKKGSQRPPTAYAARSPVVLGTLLTPGADPGSNSAESCREQPDQEDRYSEMDSAGSYDPYLDDHMGDTDYGETEECSDICLQSESGSDCEEETPMEVEYPHRDLPSHSDTKSSHSKEPPAPKAPPRCELANRGG